ncbi:hypothetical protein LLH00_03230 [bacterium]|nr:hypothetical protein [bacterium]
MVETVVAALRRAAQVVFKNLWLLVFEVITSLSAPVLMGGGMLLPMLFWWLTHGMPSPAVLAQDPLGFLVENWSLVLWAFLGWSVGACLYLFIWLYYTAGLTGVIAASCGKSAEGKVQPVELARFWKSGKIGLGTGSGVASLAALITLPPLAPLVYLAVRLICHPPSLGEASWRGVLALILKVGIPMAMSALAFAVLSWAALVWYRYALCFAVLHGRKASESLRVALRFFRVHLKPVLGLAVASLVINLLTSLTLAQFGFFTQRLTALNNNLIMLVSLLTLPVGWIFGIFMNIWLHSAVVTLFLERESKA